MHNLELAELSSIFTIFIQNITSKGVYIKTRWQEHFPPLKGFFKNDCVLASINVRSGIVDVASVKIKPFHERTIISPASN